VATRLEQTRIWSLFEFSGNPKNNTNGAVAYKRHEPAPATNMATVESQMLDKPKQVSPQDSFNENDWEEFFDDRYGRPYYYNKKTGETVWTKPGQVEEEEEEASGDEESGEESGTEDTPAAVENDTPTIEFDAEVTN
jgi:hypothetical protein